MASTSFAPCSFSVDAALSSVPHVSAMSSTRIAILSLTSPTRTIRPTTLGRGLSLWMSAKGTSRRSAMDVARLAPPASGETMTSDETSRFSETHLRTEGSA